MRYTRTQRCRKKSGFIERLPSSSSSSSSSSWALVDGKRKTMRFCAMGGRETSRERISSCTPAGRERDITRIVSLRFERERGKAPKERHDNPVRKRRNSLPYPTKKEVQPGGRPTFNSSTLADRLSPSLSLRMFSTFARRSVQNRWSKRKEEERGSNK